MAAHAGVLEEEERGEGHGVGEGEELGLGFGVCGGGVMFVCVRIVLNGTALDWTGLDGLSNFSSFRGCGSLTCAYVAGTNITTARTWKSLRTRIRRSLRACDKGTTPRVKARRRRPHQRQKRGRAGPSARKKSKTLGRG